MAKTLREDWRVTWSKLNKLQYKTWWVSKHCRLLWKIPCCIRRVAGKSAPHSIAQSCWSI